MPEVRTLREKLTLLCKEAGQARMWQSRLAKEWMASPAREEGMGLFYVDGHVRVYHGSLGPLPRQYVARQKLLLRGTADFWVNGLGGEPFFVVTQPIHSGPIAALREQVIPRLLADAPALEEAKKDDPQAIRFTIIVDREAYSPKLFAELKAQHIGVLTCHKHPGDDWSAEEFAQHNVRLHTGEIVQRDLGERGTQLSNGMWVTEVRSRNADGHQVSILSTNLHLDLRQAAAWMPARWTQEIFLKYMREHFGLDCVIEHGTLPLPETTVVANPAHRKADQEVRRERGRLVRVQAQFAGHTLPPEPSTAQLQAFEERGGQLREQITAQTAALAQVKENAGSSRARSSSRSCPKPGAIASCARKVSTLLIR